MFRICATCLLVVLALNAAVGNPTNLDANLMKLQDLVNNYRQDPIGDPYPINNFILPLDSEFSSGSVSIPTGQITGLSGLTLTPSLGGLDPLTIIVNVTLPQAKITGNYISDVTLFLCDLLPDLNLDALTMMGQGTIAAEVNNVTVSAVVVLENIQGTLKLKIRSIDLPVTFDSASANLQNLKVNDELVDWADVNTKIKPAFDKFWAENEDALSAALATMGSEIIKECTLGDITGGNLECLNLGTPKSAKATCDKPNPGNTVIAKPVFSIMALFALFLSANFI